MQISREFVSLGSIHLFIQRIFAADTKSGPTLVFLHDALGSVAQWKGFHDLVAGKLGMNALLYDRQGHGLSGPMDRRRNPNYLHREALEVLPGLLKKLNIEHPVLIGHSDGGTIALIHGAHYPVKAIITIAAHVFVEEITLEGIREAHQIKPLLFEKLGKYHGDKTEALFNAWHDTWLDSSFRDWSIEKEIRNINAPVLAIQGTADNYGTQAQVEGIINAVKGQKEKFFVEGAGHLPFKEQPNLIAEKIAAFLNE